MLPYSVTMAQLFAERSTFIELGGTCSKRAEPPLLYTFSSAQVSAMADEDHLLIFAQREEAIREGEEKLQVP